jgi:uncharacterized protein
MSGETDLARLLAGIGVHRAPGLYRFVTGAEPAPGAIMHFREREGWASIVETGPGTPPETAFAWLEISVHSGLEAVGFLAAISRALAEAGVPCNAVAGFHHDHIFVPGHLADLAEAAILSLRGAG